MALTTPVISGGKVRYVLNIGLDPRRVRSVLAAAGAPTGWVGAIADGSGRIIARTAPQDFEVGSHASRTLRDAVQKDRSGFYDRRELHGLKVETVFRHLPDTDGWTIHFAVPKSDLNGPVQRALLLLAGGASVGAVSEEFRRIVCQLRGRLSKSLGRWSRPAKHHQDAISRLCLMCPLLLS